ncbi:hypothetical protein PRK78_000179 [Emydomyces testavorans]|uniref:GAT domain-containing protein n=1 Tax=Emydomyces testavorans TaxID=2070801 RepID=A0AAF0DAZ1_9EURO|nr:hypothetical protein PRK78_000179 [Emydomyces testavorans]
MKRLVGTLKRTSTQFRLPGASHPPTSLEDTITREVTAFCESRTVNNTGDEFLHLPAIVETAESSPAAAKAAATQIHKYLSKPNASKEQQQFNAIMLIRILSDNPGPTFTRNIDSRFVSSVKILLRDGQDVSVQQILRETLEFLSVTKANDPNLVELNAMWKKEKDKFVKQFGIHPLQGPAQGTYPGYRQDYFSREHRTKTLPSPEEISGRVSEATTSAKLLLQMVQATPPSEFLQNDMLKEFANRCQRASRSMQTFMDATNPPPDEDTMITLIETNDKLSVALSKYQRAQLNARKHVKATQPQTEVDQPQESQPQDFSLNSQPVEPPPVPRSKPHIPILSIPRKIVKNFQHQPPRKTTNQSTTTTFPSGGDISPIDSDPAPPLPARPQKIDTSASQGVQYKPSRPQVEDPFTDEYRMIDDKPHDPRQNGEVHPALRERDAAGATPSVTVAPVTKAPPAVGTTSTYYPSAHDNLFDDDLNVPPAHPTGAAGNVSKN